MAVNQIIVAMNLQIQQTPSRRSSNQWRLDTLKGPNWNRNDSRLNARILSWQGNTKQLIWKNAAHHEEQENAKKEMVTKIIEKDHSDMIFNWWKELDKMAHSPILFIHWLSNLLKRKVSNSMVSPPKWQ